MSLHIICCNRESLAVIGYTPDTNLVWSFVASRVPPEAAINSFSPSRLGVQCAFSTVRVVGSCTLAVESSVIDFIMNEMMHEDLSTRVEEFIDWTRDIPTSMDVTSPEELVNRLSKDILGPLDTKFDA